MGWARCILMAAMLAAPAFAQAPPKPVDISLCEQAMLDNARTSPSVSGYRSAGRAYAGFVRNGHGFCDHAVIFRLFSSKPSSNAPTPVFSSAHPPCPEGWMLRSTGDRARCSEQGDPKPDIFVRFMLAGSSGWIDGRKCPALVPALEKMEAVLAPEVTGDKPLHRFPLMNDGISYKAWVGDPYVSGYGEYTVMASNVGTPLAAWADETFPALAPCVSAEQPK